MYAPRVGVAAGAKPEGYLGFGEIGVYPPSDLWGRPTRARRGNADLAERWFNTRRHAPNHPAPLYDNRLTTVYGHRLTRNGTVVHND